MVIGGGSPILREAREPAQRAEACRRLRDTAALPSPSGRIRDAWAEEAGLVEVTPLHVPTWQEIIDEAR